MNISYGITVYNEADELNKLLEVLVHKTDAEDEIIVCVDDTNGEDDAVRFVLDSWTQQYAHTKMIKVYQRKLNKDFAAQKNSVIENAVGDYIFHGMKDEHINRWGWRVTEKGWVNYPDYQARVFRRDSEIRWERPLHEVIRGYKTYSHLPPNEELSLYHPKTIERQEEQNMFYNKNFSREMNVRRGV